MSILRISAFALVMVLYLAYPYYLIYQQEAILEQGTPYRLKLRPVDPVDAFRGRYLALNYNLPFFAKPEALEQGQRVFLPVEEDSLGYTYFPELLLSPPSDGDYLKSEATYFTDDSVMVSTPENLQRYYLNEQTAPLAEAAVQELATQLDGSTEVRAYALVRVRKGEVRIEQLFFDGMPLREYLEKEVRE